MRLALLALACAGCSALLGLDDNFHTPPDGGITNHVGVNGVSRITYHSELATQTVPEDLAAYTIDAYTVDDAGVHVFPATVGSDGTFTIADVPATDYYLRILPVQTQLAVPTIWHLVGHDVDLSTDRMGAPGANRLTDTSLLRVSSAAKLPHTSGDTYSLYSSLESNDSFLLLDPPPVLGVQQLTDLPVDWKSHFALDANGAWLVHRQFDFRLATNLSISRAAEAGHVGGLAQRNGTPLPLAFSIDSGPAHTLSVDVDVENVVVLRGSTSGASLSVTAAPDGGAGLIGPQVLGISRFGPAPSAVRAGKLGTVSYRDPFPATWSRTTQLFALNTVRQVGSPMAFTTLTSFAIASAVTPPGDELIVPSMNDVLPAPANIRLDGMPFQDSVRLPGAALRLSWDEVRGATSYSVLLQPMAGTQIVQLVTTRPEVVVPGDTFPDGTRVVVTLNVEVSRTLEPAIRGLAKRQALRAVPLGALYFSRTCGNRAQDRDEACDSGGIASATCNFDCTAPRCGDGLVDTLAGETCDFGLPSAECDASCHAIVCGDGVKADLEACDDGNLTKNDGCSDRCDFEPFVLLALCGDTRLDLGEECDDGPTGSDRCTRGCQLTYCGDGIQQSPPGRTEECDDGNTRSGDGCSADCKTERCGDQLIVFPETCDDGNTIPGDGCSATCRGE